MAEVRALKPSSPPLSDGDTVAWRLLEADLVSGAIELAELGNHGIPEARKHNFPESPIAILERLLAAVEPEDLTRMGGGIWLRTRRAWSRHKRLSWELIASAAPEATQRTINFYRIYGMGIGLQAPDAARRLLSLRTALDSHTRALNAAVEALQEASTAVRGVAGAR